MAAGGSVYLSSLDRLSVVHQEDPSVWYLRCDVYRHLQHLLVLLSRLLSLHCRLRVGVLFTSAEPGKMLFHILELFRVKCISTAIYCGIPGNWGLQVHVQLPWDSMVSWMGASHLACYVTQDTIVYTKTVFQ